MRQGGGGASREPLGGLSCQEGHPSLRPGVGLTSAPAGGTAAISPPPPPSPLPLSPLSRLSLGKVKAGGDPGGGTSQRGSLTRVRFRFLPRSRRDGGETAAVTPALEHPCTAAARSAPRPPPPQQRALPSSDSGLGGQGGRGRPDQRCRRA